MIPHRVEELCLKSPRTAGMYVTFRGAHNIDSDIGELEKGLTGGQMQSRKGEGGMRARESSMADLASAESSSS